MSSVWGISPHISPQTLRLDISYALVAGFLQGLPCDIHVLAGPVVHLLRGGNRRDYVSERMSRPHFFTGRLPPMIRIPGRREHANDSISRAATVPISMRCVRRTLFVRLPRDECARVLEVCYRGRRRAGTCPGRLGGPWRLSRGDRVSRAGSRRRYGHEGLLPEVS